MILITSKFSLNSNGRQPMCLLHLVRTIAQPQGVHTSADWPTHLRRVLGVLLILLL